jgi:hypothetical protein
MDTARDTMQIGDDPTPPNRTVLDWIGAVIFSLLGVPPLILFAAGLYFAVTNRSKESVVVLLAASIFGGVPGTFCWMRAWRLFVGRKRNWRQSMRTRRRVCIRCGYDLRGGVEICPECGVPVPEPIGENERQNEVENSQEPQPDELNGGGDERV